MIPCDFFLWGHVKNETFKLAPETKDQLKNVIRFAFSTITLEMLANVRENWVKRLRYVISVDGGHFEHFNL